MILKNIDFIILRKKNTIILKDIFITIIFRKLYFSKILIYQFNL